MILVGTPNANVVVLMTMLMVLMIIIMIMKRKHPALQFDVLAVLAINVNSSRKKNHNTMNVLTVLKQ
jgi:hypothetical protein